MINIRKLIVYVVVIGGIGFALAWTTHIRVKRQLPLIDSARNEALPAGRKLMAELATYPGISPYGSISEEETSPSKGMWKGVKNRVVWQHEFDVPGTREEMKRWYAAKLPKEGWQIWDPTDTSELHTQWCKPFWLLTLQHNVWFNAPPSHRLIFRLEWMWDFDGSRCPLP